RDDKRQQHRQQHVGMELRYQRALECLRNARRACRGGTGGERRRRVGTGRKHGENLSEDMPGIIVSNPLRFDAMSLLVPGPDTPALRAALARPRADTWLVACFCAAWCDTCGQYRPRLAALANTQPERVFAWLDIEDHSDLLGDEDVENFPTLLVQVAARVAFYAPTLRLTAQRASLLASLGPDWPSVHTNLPPLPAPLCARAFTRVCGCPPATPPL